VVPILEELANADTTRSDRALAAALAERVLAGSFGIEGTANLGATSIAMFQEQGGVSILPYAEPDLALAVMAAMTGDPRLHNLRGYFANVASDAENELKSREERMWILAGQAAVGMPVLDDLRAAAGLPDLSVSEQVIVALGAIAAGDDDLARTVERAVLAKHGGTYGPWIRITTRTGLGDPLLTARLAIVAASLGDPLAAGMDAYALDNPPKGTAIDLERALAAAGWAKRIPAANATATLVVADGTRSPVRIEGSRPVTIVLTPAQADGARVEPGTGTVILTTRTEQPLDAMSLVAVTGVSITRRMAPATTIAMTDVVHVTITVTLDSQAGPGCWNVAELVPSGLAPVIGERGYGEEEGQVDENGNPVGPVAIAPWRVVGQRLDFCVQSDVKNPVQVLQYMARVVTPGTYTWEPTVIQSSLAPDHGRVTPASTVVITPAG